jgi:hypothetical protein
VAGDRPVLRRWQRAALARLVDRFEVRTGLQLQLYVGPDAPVDNAAADALVLVDTTSRQVHVRTAARARISDGQALQAVALLSSALAAGDLTGGVRAALSALADAAGPGVAEGPELPDLVIG